MPLPKDSILTDYQREVLNAALDSREHKEPATPSSRPVEDIQVLKSIVHPSIVASKQERRSHTPRTGRPKKGVRSEENIQYFTMQYGLVQKYMHTLLWWKQSAIASMILLVSFAT